MTAPATLPRWASSASAKLTAPTLGLIDRGFLGGERVKGQYLNWLFNLICRWISFLARDVSAQGFEIGAAAFKPVSNVIAGDPALSSVPVLVTSGASYWWPPLTGTSPSGTVAASIRLPVGAKITRITFKYSKGGQADNLSVSISKSIAGVETGIDGFTDSSAGSGEVAHDLSPDYTVEAGYQVWIAAQMAHTNHQFFSATVFWEWA